VRVFLPWARNGLAIGVSVIAIAMVLLLPGLFSGKTFILVLLAAVIISASAAGFGAGLISTAVCSLAVADLLPPLNSLRISAHEDLLVMGGFATLAVLASGLVDWTAQPNVLVDEL